MNNEELIDVKTLRPFRRFIYTIGALPSSYLISMTYEEQLVWFCNYLEKTVIPAINNNGLAVEELQAKYIELKSYVDNYFENLDVQEEINNKLDEMADSGELTDIIAQYLQLAGVLAYDTLSDLENAENIVNGSICKVLGYKSYNDGLGDYYKIRNIINTDVIDGYNIVAIINNNQLVGERINESNLKVYNITTSMSFDDVQSLMNRNEVKILNFIKGNYTYDKTFRLNKNTTLLFNGSQITFNIPTVIENWELSHGFFNFNEDDVFTEYNGNGNIELNGGIIIHGNCSFCHAKDIRIINMDFEECYNDHILEMCAINGLLVENSTFNGITSNYDNKEYINMDNATYLSFPFFNENNEGYDNTANRNWQIINNTFTVPSSDYVGYNFIGSHSYVDDYYHENIIIKNNNFMDTMNMSIQLINAKHIVIEDNYFYNNDNLTSAQTLEGSHIRLRNYIEDIIIKNNIFENGYRAIETATPHVIRDDIKIIGNTIKDFTTYTAELALINIFTSDKCVIKDNMFLNFASGCIRTNNIDSSVSSRKYYIENNTFESDISIDSGQVLIKGYDGFTYITHNTFRIYGSNKPYLIALGATSNKGIIAFNDYNIEIITASKCLFTNNYAYDYKEIKGIVFNAWNGSTTSLSDQTPDIPVTDFTCLKVTLGTGTQTYSVELFGWNIGQANIDARTWAIPIGNGYAKLTITDQGKLTYDSNGTSISLRQIQCYNYI